MYGRYEEIIERHEIDPADSDETAEENEDDWELQEDETDDTGYPETISHYRDAAEQGDVIAQLKLGILYYIGDEAGRDYAAAEKWLMMAAEQGYTRAQVELGNLYRSRENGADYDEAFKWYRKAAEQGSTVAWYHMGETYYTGKGAGQDYAEAVKWYRKAAERGSAEAQEKLGNMYHDGIGVKRDIRLPRYKWEICTIVEKGWKRTMMKLQNGIEQQRNREIRKPGINWGICITGERA